MTVAPSSSVTTRNAVNSTVSFREMLFVIQDYAVQTVCTLNLEHSAEQSRIYVIFWSTVLEQPINVQQIFICRMEHPVLKKAAAIVWKDSSEQVSGNLVFEFIIVRN